MSDFCSRLTQVFGASEFIDLSQKIETDMPKWPTHPSVVVDPTFSHERDHFFCQTIQLGEHSGTHVDAPAHQQPDMMADTVDAIPLRKLFAPAVVYPAWKLDKKAGEAITLNELLTLEEDMGVGAQAGEIALFAFGWDRYWDKNDESCFCALNMPGIAAEATQVLFERGVAALGSDTMCGDSPLLNGKGGLVPTLGHSVLLRHHILLIENLCHLTELPTRCFFIALPLRINGGSGSPIRAVALVEKRTVRP